MASNELPHGGAMVVDQQDGIRQSPSAFNSRRVRIQASEISQLRGKEWVHTIRLANPQALHPITILTSSDGRLGSGRTTALAKMYSPTHSSLFTAGAVREF